MVFLHMAPQISPTALERIYIFWGSLFNELSDGLFSQIKTKDFIIGVFGGPGYFTNSLNFVLFFS